MEFQYSKLQPMAIDLGNRKIDYYSLFFPLTDRYELDPDIFVYQSRLDNDYMGYRGPFGILNSPEKLVKLIESAV